MKQTPEHLLLEWYEHNRRDLPWRKTSDPYAVWISEIMLQQTQVDTVIPYFERFLRAFPDIASLAQAAEDEILTAWKGLGYYSRARNLHRAAQEIMERHRGVFPDSYEQIRALPGIGDYTAGAIASIAFNQPFPAVDGNVLRVLARLHAIAEDISSGQVKKQITELVRTMIRNLQSDRRQPKMGDFTQALMELGATCCTPKNPHCGICPLTGVCAAFGSGRQELLPVRKKAKAAVELNYTAAVIVRDGSLLMARRNRTRLLGGMWGLPLVLKDPALPAGEQFLKEWGLMVKRTAVLGQVRHVFSHQVWLLEIVAFDLTEDPPAGLSWIPLEQLDALPIPKAFQKALDLLKPNLFSPAAQSGFSL